MPATLTEQKAKALTAIASVASFLYEVTIETPAMPIRVQAHTAIVLRGRIRNVSQCIWPTGLTDECYLEIGAEIIIDDLKVSAARQKVDGKEISDRNSISFELLLEPKQSGEGHVQIDLLYRHLFWFSARGATPITIPIFVNAREGGSEEPAGAPIDPGSIRWFHSHEFDNGEVISGRKPLQQLRSEADIIFSESIAGKSLLDIGAWDGFFSFEAERRGASDVLATDHFCWVGPGWGSKKGFDYARSRLKSRVKSKIVDVFALSPNKHGMFDVVLFLGVLYHLPNPYEGLKQVAKLTRELAVIETVVDELDNDRPVLRFYPGRELNNDPTNFFAPNVKGLEHMLRDMGFQRFKFSPPAFPASTRRARVVVHAWK